MLHKRSRCPETLAKAAQAGASLFHTYKTQVLKRHFLANVSKLNQKTIHNLMNASLLFASEQRHTGLGLKVRVTTGGR